MSIKELDIFEAKNLIDSDDPYIIDIRDEDSYASGHIKSAKRIDESGMEEFLKGANKDRPLICYCYHGISSQSAALYFNEQGFKNVYSIIGGYQEWQESLPT